MNYYYKDFMEMQDICRNDLAQIMNSKQMPFHVFSKEIGISTATLCSFLRDNRPLQWRTLEKIKSYLKKHKETVD